MCQEARAGPVAAALESIQEPRPPPTGIITQPSSSPVVAAGRLNEFGGGQAMIDDALHEVFSGLPSLRPPPGFPPRGLRGFPSRALRSQCSRSEERRVGKE